MSDRPAIPSAIKLAVRQACGFGCVLCGLPVFHYDHVVDYAEVREHAVENLALLCPTHHQEKSSRRLPRATVERARLNPINLTRDRSAPERWHFEGPEVRFVIGSNCYVFDFSSPPEWGDERIAIEIRDRRMLSMRLVEGEMLLTAIFQDPEGRIILHVEDGEVVVSTQVFDYNIVGPTITINAASGDTLLSLLKLDDGIHVAQGYFVHEQRSLIITRDSVVVQPMGWTIRGSMGINCRVGLTVM